MRRLIAQPALVVIGDHVNEVVAEVFRLVHSEMIERRVEVVLDCLPVLVYGPPNGATTPKRVCASVSSLSLQPAKRVRTSRYLLARALAAM